MAGQITEKQFERRLLKAMRPYWIAHKHTDASPGVPDLSYTLRSPRRGSGWVELKVGHLTKEGKLRIQWTAAQRLWMKSRFQHGATVWLLVSIDECLWLLTPEGAERAMGNVLGDRTGVLFKSLHTVGRAVSTNRVPGAIPWPEGLANLLSELPMTENHINHLTFGTFNREQSPVRRGSS